MAAQQTNVSSVILDAPDPDAATEFYRNLGVSPRIGVRAGDDPSSGFRGYTLSLVVSQPNIVDAYVDTATTNGAEVLKAPQKSLWGYGGAFTAPDGAIWTIASSSKKNSGPATREFDELVLLLGVADVKASKQFYVDHGFEVEKSFGRKYVQFAGASDGITLALNGRRALAKNAGVSADGTGAHRITIVSDAGEFTDPDGFGWGSGTR